MVDFSIGLALKIALGGMGVVFIILLILSFTIGITKNLSDRIDRRQESSEEKS